MPNEEAPRTVYQANGSPFAARGPRLGIRARVASREPRSLLNSHPSREAVVIVVVMGDCLFGVAPAVKALAVVEIDQPQALGLDTQRLQLLRPPVDDFA